MTHNQGFIDVTTLGTSDMGRVKTRFKEFDRMLDDAISLPANELRTFSLELKASLFKADPTCGFCKRRIEALDDAEVDHKQRYADGGRTNEDNARLAHRYCKRADRAG